MMRHFAFYEGDAQAALLLVFTSSESIYIQCEGIIVRKRIDGERLRVEILSGGRATLKIA